jgi:serpin B
MAHQGARGATAEALATGLRVPNDQKALPGIMAELLSTLKAGTSVFRMANAFWGQAETPFADEYIRTLKEAFGAGCFLVDFAKAPEDCRKRINQWIGEKTDGYITDLLKPAQITPSTVLVLTNAVYFKGLWESVFPVLETATGAFFLAGGPEIAVPMMHRTGDFSLYQDDGLQALELPYQGRDLAMVILLPRDRNGLPAMEKTLDLARITGILGGFQVREGVAVALPRFRCEFGTDLRPVLEALGFQVAFQGGADFRGMLAAGGLQLGQVIHQVIVEVNEEGTKAAAATAVEATLGIGPEPVSFTADHPFLFFIHERKTGLVLFLGRVADPR